MNDVLPCFCGNKSYEIAYPSVHLLNNLETGGVVRCSFCQLERSHPRPLVQIHDESELYQDQDYFAGARSDVKLWLEMQESIIKDVKLYKQTGHWLDIGTGLGFLPRAAKDAGYNSVGIDLNESVVAEGQKLLGVSIYVKKLEEILDNSFDIISINHVIEHVVSPNEFISLILKKLKPDGILVVGVPNIKSGIARLLRMTNIISMSSGKNWYWRGYQLRQHLWHFSPKTLKKILPEEAMCISIKTENMVYGFFNENKFKYKILSLFFVISKFIFGGDNLRLMLTKKS